MPDHTTNNAIVKQAGMANIETMQIWQLTLITLYAAYDQRLPKDPATRNDFVNDIVNDARADAIFATVKAIVDDETSTISSTISLRVAGP